MTHTEQHIDAYFERTFDGVAEAAFVLNAQGAVLKVNSAFTALLGYGSEDIPGLRFADIAATLGRDSAVESSLRQDILCFELYLLVLAEKKPAPCTLIARSGERIPVLLRSDILYDRNGAIVQVMGIAAPERRRAARRGSGEGQDSQLRQAWETEALYRSILENSGDAVIIADLNGWIATVNDACIRMFGLERPEDMHGRYLLEFLPMAGSYTSSTGEVFTVTEEYYTRQLMKIESLFETGLAKTLGYLLKKDQTVFPVEATMSLLRDEQGQHRGTITICRDVTDKTIAERTIRQSQAFLENIFETIGDGLYVTDSRGTIRMVNRAFCDIVGYSEQELIGTPAHDLFLPDAHTAQYPRPAADRPERHESVCRRKDGSRVYVELKVTMFADPSGEAAVGTLHDITERKEFEDKLKQARDDLERKVQDRTQDLLEANTALRVLLNTRDEERLALEKKIMARVHELVMPYVEKLQSGTLHERQRALLDILAVNLRHIIAPYENAKTAPNLLLTPMEAQVANLVQYGRTTKDIAEALSLSAKTVAFHRDAIRRKLGIHNKKINLRKYLLSRS